MAEDRRETLIRMFPDYDIDILLASLTNATTEQIADWCLNNPTRVPMKRKGEKRKHPEPAPSPSGEQDVDSDLEFDDIADGLILDRLVKELLNKLKKEMALQDNKSEGTANEAKYVLGAVYPKLRVDFLKAAYQESGFRLCAALIIGFFVSNKLTQRLRDSMQNPESNMWIMTDSLATTRKRYTLDIFDGDISHYGENVTTPITTFVTIMNAMTEKYPHIINRLQLLPDAFQLRLDVPDDIEKFDCGVCFCEYTVTRRIMCGIGTSENAEDERHSFCRSCVKHQAQAATEEMPLAEGGVGLKCMAYSCKNPILYSAVRNLIPKKVRRKIDERIMEENIGNSGLNLERCRECNFAIEMEESKEENKVFACPNCEKNWCRLCEREWDGDHFGISCAELDDKNKVDKRQRELERRLNEAVIRKCKCGLQFTKSDGCNKMTCRCGKTQCYLCRQEGINYTHFCQHVRNPGVQKCHQCDKACTLWADANQLDQEVINQIRAETSEAVNPDVPGPSRPRAQRQPSPPAYHHLPQNFQPFPPAPPRVPMGFGMPLPPVPPPHRQYLNHLPDGGVHLGFNGPQGFNLNVNIEPHQHQGYRHIENARLRNEQLAQNRQAEVLQRVFEDDRIRRQQQENMERQFEMLRQQVGRQGIFRPEEQAPVRQEHGPRRGRILEDDEQREERERRRREHVRNYEHLMQDEGPPLRRNIDQIGENLYNRARDADFRPVEPIPRERRQAALVGHEINHREEPRRTHRERRVDVAEPAAHNLRNQPPPQQPALIEGHEGFVQREARPPQLARRVRHVAFDEPPLDLDQLERQRARRERHVTFDEPPPALDQLERHLPRRAALDEPRFALNRREVQPPRRAHPGFYPNLDDHDAPIQGNGRAARNEAHYRNYNDEILDMLQQEPPRRPLAAAHPVPDVAAHQRDPHTFDALAQALFDVQEAQNLGPIGGNANLNNAMPRFMNINIGQNNMVHINQDHVEQVDIRVGPAPQNVQPVIQEPIIGHPLNAQNNMEEPALNIPQNNFEQPAFEFEDANFSDVDDDDMEDSVDSSSDEIDEMFQALNGDNEPDFIEPLQPPLQEQPQQQEPNELIDLTEMEDEAPVAETDMKHIERIRDKGERFEVMPIDMNSHAHEVRQLDKDWKYVYQLIDDLKASNQKMRESMTINDTGREPKKSEAILGTLDLHDEIANFVMQKMPELNAQTEKINNM